MSKAFELQTKLQIETGIINTKRQQKETGRSGAHARLTQASQRGDLRDLRQPLE
jgi:hypothetical protein